MRLLALFSLLLFTLSGCGEGGPTGGQALVGVTIIDGLGNPPIPDQVVVIRDGRIADVAPVSSWQPPRGVQQIELPGRFVMPGLVDLHAHVTILPVDEDGAVAESMDRAASEQVLSTLLGFGITAVRNPAAPTVDGVTLRDAVAAGDILGPRILTAGEALGQTRPTYGPFGATPDEASVRLEVQRQAGLGVDFIKLYTSLAPKQVSAAIDAAHAADKKVIGHLQRTSWTEAAQMGIDAITHGAPWSASYLPPEAQEGYSGTLLERLDWLEKVDFDGEAIQEMIAVLAEKKIVVDPTLIALHTKFWGDDAMHRQNPELHLAPAVSRDAWQRHTFVDDWTPEDFERARSLWPRVLELTRRLHEGGVMLATGSDLPNPWVIPGVSLHHELRLLHDAGIPALEVLKIATYNGAIALGLESEIGSIEPGKVADLVVLATDPTQNLNGTRAISHLFFGGRYFEPAALLE